MKKFYFLLLVLLALDFSYVQAQNHFIYIQSESSKPFTVSVDNRKFNSTATGYVIIPKLKSGEYNLTVKFKDANTPETKFSTLIDRKDLGFTLKDNDQNTASLVNMQTYASLAPMSNDSYAKNEKIVDTKPVEDKNTAGAKKPVIEKSPNSSGISEKTPAVVSAPMLKRGVNKISQVQNDNNVSLLFIDVSGNERDTIDVVIPVQKEGANRNTNDRSLFQWASGSYDEDRYQTGYRRTCVHLLTTQDVQRLRKKMAAENSADKMIEEALKVSKSKCFTTADVKKLSSLFLKEQAKIKFFEALYNHVYDYIEYPQLENELTASANKEKFKSIVSNKSL